MESPLGTPIPGKDYFTTLPPELLEMITGHFSLFKKLELRRVFPKVESPFVDKMLKPAVETLYVSPNRISVEHFGHISRVEYFRRRITKVIFIPMTLGRSGDKTSINYNPHDSIKTLDVYRKRHPELSRREAQDSFNLYRRSVEELELFSTKVSDIGDEFQQEDEGISKKLSKAISSGFVRLPALKTAGVASEIDHEGLNSTWCMLSDRYKSHQHTDAVSRAADLSFRKLGKPDEHVNTFFHALEKVAPRIEQMFFGENRDLQLRFEIQDTALVNAYRIQSSMQHIKRLTISCTDAYELDIDDDEPVWGMIAESAPQLQHLRIYDAEELDPSDWRAGSGGAKVLNHFLDYGQYGKLEKSEVIGCSSGMGVISAEQLDDFLFRHCETLKKVHLDEVLVAEFQWKGLEYPDSLHESPMEDIDEKDVCASLRVLLSTAGAVMPKLKSLLVGVKRSQSRYVLFDYQKFEALAEEFGVAEKDSAWVFKQTAAGQAI